MTAEQAREVELVLNRLPFVRWDRFVETPEDTQVYGWIDRADGRSDFVLVEFDDLGSIEREGIVTFGFTSSSAEHSDKIHRLLYGDDEIPHYQCQRVEDHLRGVMNVVRV